METQNNADGGYSNQVIFAHTQAGEIQQLPEHMTTVVAWLEREIIQQLPEHMTTVVAWLEREIFSASETPEFQERITDFSGEPYRVLRAIPVTVRGLDIEGVEAAFVEGNIAWVADDRVDAVNGLKAEILNTIEDFESNKDRLGPGPKRQLDILLTYLERMP